MKSSRDVENGGHLNNSFVNSDAYDEERNVASTEAEDDPWSLPELQDTGKPWKEIGNKDRFFRICLATLKIVVFLGFLYLFICSLDFLSSAFRLLGGKAAGRVFRDNALLKNPIAGLMIGILATALLQSSSTSTSIVVSMVAADELIDVRTAIPVIMGANIGTSVTNTIVSLGQIMHKDNFRRAFAGATIHDIFNWMAVLVFLPLEVITGYLFHLSKAITDSLKLDDVYKDGNKDLLKAITKPFTSLVIQVDKTGINKIAKNEEVESLLKDCCGTLKVSEKNESIYGEWIITRNASSQCIKECKCEYWFKNTGMSDVAIGTILLVVALAVLCLSLFAIVKLLNSLLRGNIRKFIKKIVNYEFPGKCSYFTGYVAMTIGMGLTILVQSSSIFTSTLTPMVGVGVVGLDRVYPLTLGSNIGTTTTGLLAALASDPDKIRPPLQVAFCHLFFNISGIILFYPLPFMRFPVPLAKFLGVQTSKYRWFAIVYLIVMFFALPAAMFGLSVAGWEVLAAVVIPFIVLALVVLLIKLMQKKCPGVLPSKLQNWKFLPEPFRSLAPLDKLLQKMCFCKVCHYCRDVKERQGNFERKEMATL